MANLGLGDDVYEDEGHVYDDDNHPTQYYQSN
jgi:hypothetical protein